MSMRITLALLASLCCLLTVSANPAAAETGVDRIPVTFEVLNTNRSALPCSANGQTYALRGEIIGPRKDLQRPRRGLAATLYLHEFSYGAWVWSFPSPVGYDYAHAQGRDGHISVVIDRLGYDSSDHPVGTETCIGAQADMVSQVVDQLHTAGYSADSSVPIRFDRVVLAGHSVGMGIAEVAAYSFPNMDISGLAVFAWADQGFSAPAIQFAGGQGMICASGGEQAEPGSPGGYAYYYPRPEDFGAYAFNSAPPEVVEAATALRNRDPCGDVESLAQAIALNNARIREIDVPILLLFGEADRIFEPGAAERQRDAYSGSSDVTLRKFPDTGHALTLERAAPQVEDAVAEWLDAGLN
jgi:pimeloyl-ACP methyl ester carboxylesterase